MGDSLPLIRMTKRAGRKFRGKFLTAEGSKTWNWGGYAKEASEEFKTGGLISRNLKKIDIAVCTNNSWKKHQ